MVSVQCVINLKIVWLELFRQTAANF